MDEDKSIRCYWRKAVSRLRILSNSLEFGWGTFGDLLTHWTPKSCH